MTEGGSWARIWISDPNEDLLSQLTHPGFFEIIGIPTSQTLTEYFNEAAEMSGEPIPDGYVDCFVDLGSNETYHYFAEDMEKISTVIADYSQDEQRAFYEQNGIDSERVDKAMELSKRFDEFVGCFKTTDMKLPKMQTAADIDVSQLANLTVQDMDGNKVKLADVFAKNKLTMIDVWKTDCTVCVESMPELEELAKKYADQGFGILSVCVDVIDNDGTVDDDLLYDAKDIEKKAGTTYPSVLVGKEFRDLVDVVSTPTALFVDSKGNIIDGPIRGYYGKDLTAKTIEKNLAQVQ